MSFMQPLVYHGQYFAVDTSEGTEIVPCDVIGRTMAVDVSALLNYLQGTPDDPEEMCQVHSGWLARMSAPGYMDCTDWCAYASEGEAWEDLASNYGDEPGGFTTYRLPAEWASYFVNADASGLTDSEQEEADNWVAEHPELDHMSPDVIGEPFFVHLTDSGHKGCDACVYVFRVLADAQ